MRDCHHTKGPTGNMFDIRSSEFNSRKKESRKVINSREVGDEVDPDYLWHLNSLNENIEHTKPPMEKIIRGEDEGEGEGEDEDDNENDDDDDDDDVDAKYKDPQYCMFLKNLSENGKSYKLKISKDGEPPCFLEYEQPYDPLTDMNINLGHDEGDEMEDMQTDHITLGHDKGDEMEEMQTDHSTERSPRGKKGEILMKKEVSRKIKKDPQNNMTMDSCYQLFLEGSIPSEYGAFTYEGKRVNYEEKTTDPDSDSDTDSDMEICDNAQDLSEVNKKQLVPAKKELSLKEKLMHILRGPYNEKEYKELSEYIEEEKPICRLLPLRDRAISSALDGVTKSVLDKGPASFRRKLKAVQNDRPRALNLLRMFRFWLEHLPNANMFTPWLLDEFMEVLPSSHKRSPVLWQM